MKAGNVSEMIVQLSQRLASGGSVTEVRQDFEVLKRWYPTRTPLADEQFEALECLIAETEQTELEKARAASAERVGKSPLGEIEKLQQKDGAYSERNKVVAAMARLALAAGLRAGIRLPAPDESWEPDWRTIVFIDLPAGQVSWHFHDSEKHLLIGLPLFQDVWDGHSTEEKYERLNALRDWLPCRFLTGSIAEGVEFEREACAQLAEKGHEDGINGGGIARLIRARGGA